RRQSWDRRQRGHIGRYFQAVVIESDSTGLRLLPTHGAAMTAPASPSDPQLHDASLLKSQAYIDGNWIGEPRDPVHNPASGEEIARVPWLGAAEAEAAVTAASRAFVDWSRRLANQRATLLRRWFELIME